MGYIGEFDPRSRLTRADIDGVCTGCSGTGWGRTVGNAITGPLTETCRGCAGSGKRTTQKMVTELNNLNLKGVGR